MFVIVGEDSERLLVDSLGELLLQVLELFVILDMGCRVFGHWNVSGISAMLGPGVDKSTQMGFCQGHGGRVQEVVMTSSTHDSIDKLLSIVIMRGARDIDPKPVAIDGRPENLSVGQILEVQQQTKEDHEKAFGDLVSCHRGVDEVGIGTDDEVAIDIFIRLEGQI
ncbi:hypothetical protein PG993_007458 [Apiospora rasikravindrae]|uniref:Uncharacterized protein n=1 Tax=Apiospora rasikravindrae TaxID=990691 RepID=A0ABR1SXJ3_9PEZI